MPFLSLKSTSFTLMVGSVTSSPATQDIVRGRGSLIHASFDGTLTPRTKLPRKAFAHTLSSAGAQTLSRNRRMPRILRRQGKHSKVQSFGMDQSQPYLKEQERAR